MTTIVFRRKAEQDVRSIYTYGKRQWGIRQAAEHFFDIQNACKRLSAFQLLGAPIDHVKPDLRMLIVRPHLIFYRYDARLDRIVIERVLDGRMDYASIL